MLWVISELRFSTKESDEIVSFVIEDFYAACGNLSWISWSTLARLNLFGKPCLRLCGNVETLFNTDSR